MAETGATYLLVAVVSSSGLAALLSLIGNLLICRMERKHKKEDKKYEQKEKADEVVLHIQKGLCVMLYDRIKYLGYRYIKEGCITPEELNDLLRLQTVFQDDLNGNGLLTAIMTQVKKLAIVDDKEKDKRLAEKYL